MSVQTHLTHVVMQQHSNMDCIQTFSIRQDTMVIQWARSDLPLIPKNLSYSKLCVIDLNVSHSSRRPPAERIFHQTLDSITNQLPFSCDNGSSLLLKAPRGSEETEEVTASLAAAKKMHSCCSSGRVIWPGWHSHIKRRKKYCCVLWNTFDQVLWSVFSAVRYRQSTVEVLESVTWKTCSSKQKSCRHKSCRPDGLILSNLRTPLRDDTKAIWGYELLNKDLDVRHDHKTGCHDTPSPVRWRQETVDLHSFNEIMLLGFKETALHKSFNKSKINRIQWIIRTCSEPLTPDIKGTVVIDRTFSIPQNWLNTLNKFDFKMYKKPPEDLQS